MPLEITREKRSGVMLLGLSGRIDFGEAGLLEAELGNLLADGELRIVMDFSQVQAVSGHGLRLLIRWSRELSGKGGKLVLHSPGENVRCSFDNAGLALIVRICNSVEEAMLNAGNTGLLPACPLFLQIC